MKLNRFIIEDLFGFQRVDIPFESNYKVLIGENGIGKTTVLNALYYILAKRFEKLCKIPFSTIELHVNNKKKIIIRKTELIHYVEKSKDGGKSHFSELLGKANKDQVSRLFEIIRSERPIQEKRLEVNSELSKIGIRIGAPAAYIYDMVTKFLSEIEANKFLNTVKDLDEIIDFRILYFPTYRRIEEELKNIGFVPKKEIVEKYGDFFDPDEVEDLHKKNFLEDMIQFGMTDVEERIKRITSEITKSSIIGFSEITGQMLHQLLTGFPEIRSSRGIGVEPEKLQIILDRMGPNISVEDKQSIMKVISSPRIANQGLFYFIKKLVDLYNKQEVLDMSLKKFAETCNGYLKRKRYHYNEREVSLKIIRDKKKTKGGKDEPVEEVPLNQLSSGEKQIVSLFSKIYLEKGANYVVLFDEPELSLSLLWQQKLLPDIVNSEKCKFLLAVTHSPFIYENSLGKHANGLSEYISEA